MLNKRREFPVWFKLETIVFLFFSLAVGFSYFDMRGDLNEIEAKKLFFKLLALLLILLVIWLLSLWMCFKDKILK